MKIKTSFLLSRPVWRTTFFFSCLAFFCLLVLTNCDGTTTGSQNTDGASGTATDVLTTDSDGNVTATNFLTDNAYRVPHDLAEPTAGQLELATFAWQEFIALNWPSDYNTRNYSRGKPDTTGGIGKFLGAGQNPGKPLVWQTYKHRVEVFPENVNNYNTSFNTPPRYLYAIKGQSSIPRLGDPSAPTLRNVTNIFNNLDETSEIDLCTLFSPGDPDAPGAARYPDPGVASFLPGAPRRIIYEAKANEQFFNYVVQQQLYDTTVKKDLVDTTFRKINNDNEGGQYPCPQGIICFPHGEINGVEGSIEVKASWRQLTKEEYESGRFLTAPVLYYRQGTRDNPSDKTIYYETVPAHGDSTALPFGLVGLHIIHKTKNFPTYVFATFEQVDNLAYDPGDGLFLYNRDTSGFVQGGRQDVSPTHVPALTDTTEMLNQLVQNEIRQKDVNSVWQYYKLIGVQGQPSSDNSTPNYYLANSVTETNTVLANFSGKLNKDGTKSTGNNILVGPNSFDAGGCNGCHGNAQQADFSFITLNGPFKGTPDVVNQPLYKAPEKKNKNLEQLAQ